MIIKHSTIKGDFYTNNSVLEQFLIRTDIYPITVNEMSFCIFISHPISKWNLVQLCPKIANNPVPRNRIPRQSSRDKFLLEQAREQDYVPTYQGVLTRGLRAGRTRQLRMRHVGTLKAVITMSLASWDRILFDYLPRNETAPRSWPPDELRRSKKAQEGRRRKTKEEEKRSGRWAAGLKRWPGWD